MSRDAGLVHFSVQSSAVEVAASSDSRLQFEPRGWQIEFRRELREALARLEPRAGHGLLAEYLAPDEAFVDVENVLLYNVGTSAFTPASTTGIACRRGRSPDHRHHVNYRLVEFVPCPGEGPLIGQVTAELGSAIPRTAGQWWAALRRSAVILAPPAGQVNAFTVDVVLAGPGSSSASLVSMLKPLLDGLISCFHAHDRSNEPILRQALVTRGLPSDAWDWLVADGTNILGSRPLVRPFRDGVSWNPADDRCWAFRARRETSPRWEVMAELRQR